MLALGAWEEMRLQGFLEGRTSGLVIWGVCFPGRGWLILLQEKGQGLMYGNPTLIALSHSQAQQGQDIRLGGESPTERPHTQICFLAPLENQEKQERQW